MPLQVSPGQTLTIVVENQGRVCYGPELADRLIHMLVFELQMINLRWFHNHGA